LSIDGGSGGYIYIEFTNISTSYTFPNIYSSAAGGNGINGGNSGSGGRQVFKISEELAIKVNFYPGGGISVG
jgi:hypothetical protein